MRVLLDTCVVSELQRRGGELRVRKAVAALISDETFLSVITVGEITRGVLRLPAGRRRTELMEWLQSLDRDYRGRLLAVDRETVAVWGEITARAEALGRILPIADGLIAATALQHGLRIYTRNTEDFEVTGVMLTNPWSP